MNIEWQDADICWLGHVKDEWVATIFPPAGDISNYQGSLTLSKNYYHKDGPHEVSAKLSIYHPDYDTLVKLLDEAYVNLKALIDGVAA